MRIFQKKRHWYRVRFEYKIKRTKIFDVTLSVGVIKQKDIDNHREIKKSMFPGILKVFISEGNKKLLNNGSVYVEPTVYLGRWA
jgi:hypothetical protein